MLAPGTIARGAARRVLCIALALLAFEAAPALGSPRSSPDARALAAEADALARRWAPNFVQDVDRARPEQDRPLRIDFDGDWDATNNWRSLGPEHATEAPAVYAGAILTETHAYLSYTLFYPRDWAPFVCLPYVCHDNDLETALIVVTRGASEIVYVETKFHREYLARPAAEVLRDATGRPWIDIESGGHGMQAVHRRAAPHGSTLFAFDGAEPPRAPPGVATESYELLSLRDGLWSRRAAFGAAGKLWTEGDTGLLGYSGERFGRLGGLLGVAMSTAEYAGGVRPPWGLQAAAGRRGDWFLDPAHVAWQRRSAWLGQGASRPSLDYAWNPYLDDLARECSGDRCPTAPEPRPATGPLHAASGLLLVVGLISLGAPRRLLRGFRRARRRWRER